MLKVFSVTFLARRRYQYCVLLHPSADSQTSRIEMPAFAESRGEIDYIVQQVSSFFP